MAGMECLNCCHVLHCMDGLRGRNCAQVIAVPHRTAVRNVRQKLMQEIGRLERDGELSSDEQHRLADSVQQVGATPKCLVIDFMSLAQLATCITLQNSLACKSII